MRREDYGEEKKVVIRPKLCLSQQVMLGHREECWRGLAWLHTVPYLEMVKCSDIVICLQTELESK